MDRDDERARFEFGANWTRFLATLDERRIDAARRSLERTLPGVAWSGSTFLDVGCGSGLFSLAARQLGAAVTSVDYDARCVACTEELKRRFFAGDERWTILRGSALDPERMARLGRFDVVYAWGSLHHTGDLWRALDVVAPRVGDRGRLVVSVYNDQGWASGAWRRVKQAYNALPPPLRFLVVGPAFVRLWGPTVVKDLLRLRPFATWREYGRERGMTPWRNVVDWVGGYPFEVARPEAIFDFFRGRGFALERLTTVGGGHGCNEFVFARGGVERSASLEVGAVVG